MNSFTVQQLGLMAHAVGLANTRRQSPRAWKKLRSLEACYRNYFLTGADSSDFAELQKLAAAGMMTERKIDSQLTGFASFVFCVTVEGFAQLQAFGMAPPATGRA